MRAGGSAFRVARRYVLAAGLIGAAAAQAVDRTAAHDAPDRALLSEFADHAPLPTHSRPAAPIEKEDQPADRRIRVADDDAWLRSLRNGSYFSGRSETSRRERSPSRSKGHSSTSSAGSRSSSTPVTRQAARSREQTDAADGGRQVTTSAAHAISTPSAPRSLPSVARGTTYQTMCVRLCDGYYWPVGNASSTSDLKRDSAMCEQSCQAPAQLYYRRDLGGPPEDMVNLDGEPYANLSKAFAYRTTYDASCKCKPHPWEPAAIARHAQYAREAQEQAAQQEQPAPQEQER